MEIVGARLDGGRLSCLPALHSGEFVLVQSASKDHSSGWWRCPRTFDFKKSSRQAAT